MSPVFRQFFKHGRGFTIVELLIVMGILGTLSAISIRALNPGKQLLATNDAKRLEQVKQFQAAFTRGLIGSGGTLSSTIVIPTTQAAAVYICKQGVPNGTDGCLNLDFLVPKYLVTIPQDTLELCASYSGYKVYKNNQFYTVFAANQGKSKTQITLDPACVSGSGGGPEVKLMANILGSTELTTTGQVVDFGSAEQDSAEPTVTFSIQNNGTSNLTFAGLAIAPSTRFYISGALPTSPILPSTTKVFTVKLRTNVMGGPFNETLSFTTNDTSEPSFSVTVRGTITAPDFSVSYPPDMQLWLRAEDALTDSQLSAGDGDPITYLYDQSPSQHLFVQYDPGLRPTFDNTTFGFPVMRFNANGGQTHTLTSENDLSLMPNGDDVTIFFAMIPGDQSEHSTAFLLDYGFWKDSNFYLRNDDNNEPNFGFDYRMNGTGEWFYGYLQENHPQSMHIFAVRKTDTSIQFFRDGSPTGATWDAPTGSVEKMDVQLTIGGNHEGNNTYTGGISEVIIYNHSLADGSEMDAVTNYLMNKYGL